MDVQKIQELIEKSNQLFKDKKLDVCLSIFYDETQHYYPWSQNQDDFETKWNFGLKNISNEVVDIEISYDTKITDLLVGEFDGVKFKIGGQSKFSEFGNDYYIVLYLNENLVVNSVYSYDMDSYSDKKYKFTKLDEFHFSKELENFLNKVRVKIEDFKKTKIR